MREVYTTPAIVLKERPYKEDSAEVSLLTQDLGRVRAVAQAAKRPGAKFAAATQPAMTGVYVLVRGRQQWRVRGVHDLAHACEHLSVKERATYLRILGLCARLMPDEQPNTKLFHLFWHLSESLKEDIKRTELFVVYGLLSELGYADLSCDINNPKEITRRINEGIQAAQL